MTHYIFKTYYIDHDWLTKNNINEASHLMWKAPFSGSPCIDAQLWDKYKDKLLGIKIRTNKRRLFRCSKEVFEKNKELITYAGLQYGIPKEHWVVKKY